jgi:hypothetical protein
VCEDYAEGFVFWCVQNVVWTDEGDEAASSLYRQLSRGCPAAFQPPKL